MDSDVSCFSLATFKPRSTHDVVMRMRMRAGRWKLPLKVVRPWVFVFPVWAEWTDVAGRIVYEAVSDHLVLPLESFATFASWTAFYTAIVWPI